MSLRETSLSRSYDSGEGLGAIASRFYVPALQEALAYDRLAGYFSSTSLAVAARGVAGLIRNGGRMRLIMSPVIEAQDLAAITQANGEEYVKDSLLSTFDLDSLASEIARDHCRAMCWMLASGLLEVRVVVPEAAAHGGLFHQKVGILVDVEGNVVSFSGSVNETASGWLRNIEHFKVFRGWVPIEEDYVADDISLFERYWNGSATGASTIPLPDAVRARLLEAAPSSFDPELLDSSPSVGSIPTPKMRTELWPHQQRAVEAWLANDGRGLLEMATGAGKTKTALECVRRLDEQCISGKWVVFVVPQQHLVDQWARDVRQWFPTAQLIEAHGLRTSWRNEVLEASCRVAAGTKKVALVIAVQNTATGHEFSEAAHRIADAGGESIIVADEAHGLGAPAFQQALSDGYMRRLGLSATPSRWFDDEGTQLLLDYFDGVVFEFSIRDALTTRIPGMDKTILTPYRYHPRFVSLDAEELDEYRELTRRAARAKGRSTRDERDWEEHILFMRAAVVKKAQSKVTEFARILDDMGNEPTGCIVYCSDQEQMRDAEAVLQSQGIIYSEFTGHEGSRPEVRWEGLSERQHLLKHFGEGTIPVLVAMKCLDEGVDVPSARTGVILASSTNPREFIQRRGRLLRNANGKDFATIYDIIVRPSPNGTVDEAFRAIELRIFEKELARVEEFASTAQNAAECYAAVMAEVNSIGAREGRST